MNATTKAIGLALMMGGCAGPSSAAGEQEGPPWWRYASTTDNPAGGAWQADNGACLYVWYDRVEWDGKTTECGLVNVGGWWACLDDGEGYAFEAVDDAGGFLGPIVLTFPEGRTLDMEPDCR